MRREGRVSLVCSLLVTFSLVTFSPAISRADQVAPNVVVIIVDDMSFELLDRMPNVRSLLVDHGETFSNNILN